MHFVLVDYTIWFASPFLLTMVLIVLLTRSLHRSYPCFFSYIIFQVGTIVFLLAEHYSASLYLDGHWVIEILGIVISLAVFREVFKDIFRQSALCALGDILFTWSAWTTVFVICLWAAISLNSRHSSIAPVFLLADRSVRLMQCGVGFSVLLMGRYLGISRRHIIYGIALGFGLFTPTSMLMTMGMSYPHLIDGSTYWRIILAARDLAGLIWLVYAALGATATSSHTQVSRFQPVSTGNLSQLPLTFVRRHGSAGKLRN